MHESKHFAVKKNIYYWLGVSMVFDLQLVEVLLKQVRLFEFQLCQKFVINQSSQSMIEGEQSLLKKAITREDQVSKQQISDILYVVKQIIGVLLGISIAFSQVKGLYAMLIYIAVSYFIAYFYIFRFKSIEDDVIEAIDVFKESWGLGFFNFMFAWIVTYNLIHYYKI